MDSVRFIKFIIGMLSLILAIVFFYNGISKIMGFPSQVTKFETLAIPETFLFSVGILECLGALFLTVPRLAIVGGSVLALIMITSAGLNMIHDDMMSSLRAISITLMLGGICYFRFKYRNEAE